jgi:aspartate/methionine/tyrosine aminotransferase
MGRLEGESAFEVLARAKALEAQGKHVVHLEIGEPDFSTPANIVEAGINALREGQTHYTPSQGLLPLREAVAVYAGRHKNRPTVPEEVVIVPGGKPVIFYTLMALASEGDEVIYPDPGFPTYRSMVSFVGAVPVPVAIREENDFRLDTDELKAKITPRTKLVILNSPANPTCGTLTPEDVTKIAAVLAGRGIYVLSDEIYDRIVYEGAVKSISSIPEMKDFTIVLDGFSKTYAMTGWRLGYGIMNSELARHVTTLMTNSNSCVAAFTQYAGIEALTGPQDSVDAMVAEFRSRRDLIVDGLNSISRISCKKPSGAFYAFPNITKTGMSSQQFADLLLNEGGVAALAGSSFGAAGEGYLRLSYANSVENIKISLERIDGTLKKM